MSSNEVERLLRALNGRCRSEKSFMTACARMMRIPFNPVQPPYPENVLIIQGYKDAVVNPKDTISYARTNGIRIEVFEGADHRYGNPGEKERIVKAAKDFLLGSIMGGK